MSKGRARARLRVLHRRLLVLLASDITDETAARSAIVVAPHPDDETIGCGAVIMRKVDAGALVHVVVATGAVSDDGGNGEPSSQDALRRAECLEAGRRLGLDPDQVVFLGVADGQAARHVDDLEQELLAMVDRVEPDDVFVPWSIDAHADHRAVAEAMSRVVASRPYLGAYAYPIWCWNRWAWIDARASKFRQRLQLWWRPIRRTVQLRPVTVRMDDLSARKRHALDAHQSQLEAPADDPDRPVLDPEWLDLFLGDEELFFDLRDHRVNRLVLIPTLFVAGVAAAGVVLLGGLI